MSQKSNIFNTLSCIVSSDTIENIRIDTYLAQTYPEYSRSFFAKLCKTGNILYNSTPVNPSCIVTPGNTITISIPLVIRTMNLGTSEISILQETDDWLAIDKPAGIAVHPASLGSQEYSITDWFNARYPGATTTKETLRNGIVHRLDKETSGVLLLAKTSDAHTKLQELFAQRSIKKTYQAIVEGQTPPYLLMQDYLVRSKHDPRKIIVERSGREALSELQTLEQSATHSYINLFPSTGRTHQLRVQCASRGFPIVGDIMYGKKRRNSSRHYLHALSLNFIWQGAEYLLHAPLPPDFIACGAEYGIIGK